jgi:tetratricopeptide (TPR) repeat protein/tRNA A-37 threonylcarbamoyl transferase component Bud32
MDPRDAANRDLLIGLLALQNGLIDQDVLVTAFRAWTRDKSKPIAELLAAQGAIDLDERSLLEGLAAKHIKRSGGDSERTLAAINAAPSIRRKLAGIGDAAIETSIGHVSGPAMSTETDSERTTSFDHAGDAYDSGRFRVLRPHAKGGLGAVFVALDEQLHREVALKQILEHHADDPANRARFVLEAEITGRLEHPGIVPVYGLGSYRDGRPYYAMRFIKGDSLKVAVAEFHADADFNRNPGRRSLAFRELLRRFVDVCNAIGYAHTRGVLHRDVKPSNIIVGNHGETLVVDWGLTKVIGRQDPHATTEERSLVPTSASGSSETVPGSALGTPAFMSPEQASGDLDRVGPRSDVYSLGATLYYIMTGKPPFEDSDIGAVLQAVKKGSFPKPRALDPSIDRSLEAVCLKAMAVDPSDRHPTPRALADDLERWAADEPVSAWREPLVRRLRRWGRRNRTAVAVGAVAVLAALVGTGVVLAVQTKANAGLQALNYDLLIANARETRANADLMEANSALAAAKDREVARFTLAADAIKLFQGQVGDALVLKEDRFKPLRDKLLNGAVDFYAKLEMLLEGQTDPASRKAMGNAYFELGDVTAKIGDKSAALAAHRKGLAVRRELASMPDADVEARGRVAMSLLETALLLHGTGNSVEALARGEEARELLESLLSRDSGSGERGALLARVFKLIGKVHQDSGKMDKATSAFRQSVEIMKRLADENPVATDFQSELARSHLEIGNLERQIGKPAEALESYRRALAIRRKLAGAKPAATEFQSELARNYIEIGVLSSMTGKPTEALESYRLGVAILQELVDANPAVTGFRSLLARGRSNIGALMWKADKPTEALESYRQALWLWEKLSEENPAVADFQSFLALTHNNKAMLLLDIAKPAEALIEEEQAQAIFQRLADLYPTVSLYRSDVVIGHTALAAIHLKLGRAVLAQANYEKAVAIGEKLVQTEPETTRYRSQLAYCVRRLGLMRLRNGDAGEAAADAHKAAALYEGLPSLSATDWFELASCHAALAAAAVSEGSGISAGNGEAEAAKAMDLLRRAVRNGYRRTGDLASETAFDTLRDRPDFHRVVMDLAMPADPFAK